MITLLRFWALLKCLASAVFWGQFVKSLEQRKVFSSSEISFSLNDGPKWRQHVVNITWFKRCNIDLDDY